MQAETVFVKLLIEKTVMIIGVNLEDSSWRRAVPSVPPIVQPVHEPSMSLHEQAMK
jgi:hypothetical protein